MHKIIITLYFMAFVTACAGPNPNPGERTTDIAWTTSKFQRAFNVAKPRAEAGQPWAQLRLGIFYENGWGIPKDITKAELWYKKALTQKAKGNWAEGQLIGATGKSGYFNQNSDAKIAEFNLAQLYYTNNKNLNDALFHINNVLKESNGKSIFFCCEFAGGRYFDQEQFTDLKQKIEKKLNEK